MSILSKRELRTLGEIISWLQTRKAYHSTWTPKTNKLLAEKGMIEFTGPMGWQVTVTPLGYSTHKEATNERHEG